MEKTILKKFYVVLASTLMMLSGCTNEQIQETDTAAETQENTKAACSEESTVCEPEADSESEETKEEDQMTSMTMDEAIQFFEEKKSGVLYFGFESCPWCIEAKPVLLEAGESYEGSIYYIITRDEDKNRLYNDEQKEEIIPYIGDYMSENENGELTLYVPLVLVVKDGVVIDGHEGTFEDHDAHERTMTQEEIDELYQIYSNLFTKA
jgi:thiol-disulfide isomerase/thioredoxin